MTTWLDAMWHAVDATADDDEAIAIVERERHAGCGTDERGMTMTRFTPKNSQWDAECVAMVRRMGWQTAYDLTRRMYRENSPGSYSHMAWTQTLAAFERARTIG